MKPDPNLQPENEPDDIILKLTKDLKTAVLTLNPREARFLVDCYYNMQDNRVRAASQVRAMDKDKKKNPELPGEPHLVLDWLTEKSEILEGQVRAALDIYSKTKVVGRWSRSIKGIGPVLAAGLMAHIDITKSPTVGHIWNFAGLGPGIKWEKGKKRPWNAALKTLQWKIGESFVKVSGRENAYYGKVYLERKALEIANNDLGKFVDQAKTGAEYVGKDTDSWPWYAGCFVAGTTKTWIELADTKAREEFLKQSKGAPGSGLAMLPPGHIHARAKRYAVKLFLAHWHEVAYKDHYKKDPPNPYPIAHLGHTHKIDPPDMPEASQR